MAHYSQNTQQEVHKALREMKQGKLKSGKSKATVHNRDQAIAIGLSKARDKHYNVPKEHHEAH